MVLCFKIYEVAVFWLFLIQLHRVIKLLHEKITRITTKRKLQKDKI